MKNNKSKTSFAFLIIAACFTFLGYGYFPHDKLHPIYTILSILPLQLGAIAWIYFNGYLKGLNINFKEF